MKARPRKRRTKVQRTAGRLLNAQRHAAKAAREAERETTRLAGRPGKFEDCRLVDDAILAVAKEIAHLPPSADIDDFLEYLYGFADEQWDALCRTGATAGEVEGLIWGTVFHHGLDRLSTMFPAGCAPWEGGEA